MWPILLVVAVVAAVYFLVKQFSLLVANAVTGLILLVILNFFHIMQWMGKPDLGYDLATVLICAVGGVPGGSASLSSSISWGYPLIAGYYSRPKQGCHFKIC